jgi:hypothetical protein
VGIILLFVGASTPLGLNASCTNPKLPRVVQQNIQAIQQDVIGQPCLVGNALISSNAGNDSHPRMTTNSLGHTIVVYEQELEQEIGFPSKPVKQILVVYSADAGRTWTTQFLFDSRNFTSGSGILQYPDIVYNVPNDLLYLTMIDPEAEMYNNEMSFMSGDIAHAENASWYGISGGIDYFYVAGICTNNFFLSWTTEDDSVVPFLGLWWGTYPDFEFPPGIAGFYYDAGSLHQSSPAGELEMDSNVNQIFFVCETDLDSGTQITIKTNVKDEGLITSGEQQNQMEKYADNEQMLGEYLGLGTDPDVSGSGNKVCVVYVEEGDVICKSSTTQPTYDPGFNWHTSTVDTDACAPAVYMAGEVVYCAYVKEGNVYLKTSEDGGLTWGASEQKNDVGGTAIAEKGSVDIGKTGIAFTDNRNENYDIYFQSVTTAPASYLVIESISGGRGIGAIITNYGDAPIEHLNWSITIDGLIFVGKEKSGTLSSLAPGASMMIHLDFMLGFGPVTATFTADSATLTQRFKLLLFFIKEV